MVNKNKLRQQLEAANKELKELREVEKQLIAEQARSTRLENEVEWLRSLVTQPPAPIASSTAPGPTIPTIDPEDISEEILVRTVEQLLEDESGDALRKKLVELGWTPSGRNAKSTRRVMAEFIAKKGADKGTDAVRDYIIGYRSNYEAGKRVATETGSDRCYTHRDRDRDCYWDRRHHCQ
jgi:hypothetical protein